MKQTPNTTQIMTDNRNTVETKQVYTSPRLLEYGSIAKLTKGSSGPANDGMGTTKP